MKPIIALYANVFDTTVGQNIAYMNFFALFGEVILVSSESDLERIIQTCDILALPGGADVNSVLYKSVPGFYSNRANPHYEYLDKYLLDPWIKTEKPIIGICRGIQVLNVHMGGTLHNHVIGHVQDDKKGRDYTPDTMYTPLVKNKRHPINTFHHQAVAQLAEGFEVLGWSDLYKGCPSLRSKHVYSNKGQEWNAETKKWETYENAMCIELIMHKTLPYLACQYHPEETMDELFSALIQEHIIPRINDNSKIGTKEKAKG